MINQLLQVFWKRDGVYSLIPGDDFHSQVERWKNIDASGANQHKMNVSKAKEFGGQAPYRSCYERGVTTFPLFTALLADKEWATSIRQWVAEANALACQACASNPNCEEACSGGMAELFGVGWQRQYLGCR